MIIFYGWRGNLIKKERLALVKQTDHTYYIRKSSVSYKIVDTAFDDQVAEFAEMPQWTEVSEDIFKEYIAYLKAPSIDKHEKIEMKVK